MNVSADAPYFDMAYKIVTYAGRNVLKLGAGKATWTGEKQVFRFRGRDGSFAGDVLALRDEPAPAGAEPLLGTVMRRGELVEPLPSLPATREYARAQIAELPDAVRRLRDAAAYEVRYSERLRSTQRALEAETRAAEVGNALAHAGRVEG
jgi:nicotinate phosphoribosyltransferase